MPAEDAGPQFHVAGLPPSDDIGYVVRQVDAQDPPSNSSSLTLRGMTETEPSVVNPTGSSVVRPAERPTERLKDDCDDCTEETASGPPTMGRSDNGTSLLPQQPRSFTQRTVGELTIDGIRHSCLTLTSTALGGGLLAVAYVMEQVGIGLGVLMLAIGATLAYLSTIALMRISTETGETTYAGLFTYCAGPRAGPILDFMLFIYGNGSCVGYFVFLGDFISALVDLADAPDWCSSRWFCITSASLVILPLALQRDLASLRHITPVSILALVYVAIVILARCMWFYNKHEEADPDHQQYGELKVFDFNLGLFNAFAICVFAFNCHINVVPVAGRLIRPTKERIRKVAWWVNGIQFSFYTIIGVSGYLTFLQKTPQDILKGFDSDDPYMAIGRVLLSFTMIVAIPVNLNPAVRSGLQIRDYFFPASPWLASSPRASPTSSPQSSPRANDGTPASMRSNEGNHSMRSAPGSMRSMTSQGGPEAALPRIILVFVCVLVQVLTAIVVPGVADVLGLLGATVATAMMMLIPAHAIGKVLPHTVGYRFQQVVLCLFACVGLASVPIKFLASAKVIHLPK